MRAARIIGRRNCFLRVVYFLRTRYLSAFQASHFRSARNETLRDPRALLLLPGDGDGPATFFEPPRTHPACSRETKEHALRSFSHRYADKISSDKLSVNANMEINHSGASVVASERFPIRLDHP